MPLEQRMVPVHFLDGGEGIAASTGNNAAWHCRCSRELPLIGRSGLLGQHTSGYQIDCPACILSYLVFPIDQDQGRVRAVEEVARDGA